MKKLAAIFSTFALALTAMAQSGGPFDLTQTVVGGGGGTSAGGNFSIDMTAGQPFAGRDANNPPFSLTIGFWNFTPLAPTAAPVMVSGKVTSLSGTPIPNARITLTSQAGIIRTALTNPFGYYQIFDVPSGETYVLSVSAKSFSFSQASRLINVNDAISDADFTADN